MFLRSIIPSIFLPLSNSSFDSGFVRMSAAWSLLATCFSSTFPSFTCSRIKWNLTSICLLHSWFTGFFASSIADLLSTWIIVASSYFDSILLSNLLSHIAWHTHQDAATYSASHVERVTIGCFLESQVNAVFPMKNTYPEVLFRSSMSPHQSLSE